MAKYVHMQVLLLHSAGVGVLFSEVNFLSSVREEALPALSLLLKPRQVMPEHPATFCLWGSSATDCEYF